MKNITLVFIALISFSIQGLTQDYETAAGVRGGFFNGVSIKHFMGSTKAVEGILSTRYNGIRLTGLIEFHQEAFEEVRLKFYYGGGAHIAFYSSRNFAYFDEGRQRAVIGVDGIIGLEYTVEDYPINIGLDWKPYLNLLGSTNFGGDGGALTIRYIF